MLRPRPSACPAPVPRRATRRLRRRAASTSCSPTRCFTGFPTIWRRPPPRAGAAGGRRARLPDARQRGRAEPSADARHRRAARLRDAARPRRSARADRRLRRLRVGARPALRRHRHLAHDLRCTGLARPTTSSNGSRVPACGLTSTRSTPKRAAFPGGLSRGLADAYPAQPSGAVMFPFPRLFVAVTSRRVNEIVKPRR